MDDIIKLLQKLLAESPRPKGGIADTAEGIEFLGKALTKEQRGSLVVVNSRLTDASRFRPFDVRNVGRDKRYRYMFEYEQDLAGEFNKTIEFLKNPKPLPLFIFSPIIIAPALQPASMPPLL